MTTTSPITRGPDQTARARRLINDAIYRGTGTLTDRMARLIAVALYPSADSALHDFAITGRADPDRIEEELAALTLSVEQSIWRDALVEFLAATGPGRLS